MSLPDGPKAVRGGADEAGRPAHVTSEKWSVRRQSGVVRYVDWEAGVVLYAMDEGVTSVPLADTDLEREDE